MQSECAWAERLEEGSVMGPTPAVLYHPHYLPAAPLQWRCDCDLGTEKKKEMGVCDVWVVSALPIELWAPSGRIMAADHEYIAWSSRPWWITHTHTHTKLAMPIEYTHKEESRHELE